MVAGGKYTGWLITAELERSRSVKAALRQLVISGILSGDAPVKELLAVLASEQLVFLAGHRGLEAFVTKSDPDRHAARGHF